MRPIFPDHLFHHRFFRHDHVPESKRSERDGLVLRAENNMLAYLPPVVVALPEFRRLSEMAEKSRVVRRVPCAADLLERELNRATIATPDELPPTVVGMNDSFDCLDAQSGRRFRYTLAYPGMDHVETGGLSVLSVLGAAALGLGEGDSMPWTTPTGEKRILKILRVHRRRDGALHG